MQDIEHGSSDEEFHRHKERIVFFVRCTSVHFDDVWMVECRNDFSFTEEAAGTKGDVNLDGSVDISDVVLMVNYILGDSSLVNVPLYGDMNDDSSVDISDVVALVNIILGGS